MDAQLLARVALVLRGEFTGLCKEDSISAAEAVLAELAGELRDCERLDWLETNLTACRAARWLPGRARTYRQAIDGARGS